MLDATGKTAAPDVVSRLNCTTKAFHAGSAGSNVLSFVRGPLQLPGPVTFRGIVRITCLRTELQSGRFSIIFRKS